MKTSVDEVMGKPLRNFCVSSANENASVEAVRDEKNQEDPEGSASSETVSPTMLKYNDKPLNRYSTDACKMQESESESERKFRSQFFIVVCVILFTMMVLYIFNFLERITTVVICTSVGFLLSETRTVIADSSMRSVREMVKIQSKEGALKKLGKIQHQLRYSKG